MTLTGSQLLSSNGGQMMCEDMVARVLLFLMQVNNSQALPDRDQVCPGWRAKKAHTCKHAHTSRHWQKRTFCEVGTRRNATTYPHKRLGAVEFEDAVCLHTPAAAIIPGHLHIFITLRRKEDIDVDIGAVCILSLKGRAIDLPFHSFFDMVETCNLSWIDRLLTRPHLNKHSLDRAPRELMSQASKIDNIFNVVTHKVGVSKNVLVDQPWI